MEILDKTKCSLQQAREIIKENLHALPPERVEVGKARKRIASGDITAVHEVPAFAESTRDGYVLASGDYQQEEIRRFRIVDEIPAGLVRRVSRLEPGTACRIMTGGWVPDGSERIVPFEQCIEKDGEVRVDGYLLHNKSTFIRPAGSEIAHGQRLVESGGQLQAEHLELLSSCGVQAVSVSSLPVVGYFCTGSELKALENDLADGQKVSSNSFLLEGILASFGAEPKNLGIVADNYQDLLASFSQVNQGAFDILISTGGMGPGKYDLVEQAFTEAGGQVFFNAIAMRPGKSVLFGRLGKAVFFGLPGPPHAVRALLYVLVGPALLAMQAARDVRQRHIQAHLQHPFKVQKNNVLQLRDGVVTFAGAQCFVRFAERLEISNCYIHIPPERLLWEEGDLVDIQIVADPFAAL